MAMTRCLGVDLAWADRGGLRPDNETGLVALDAGGRVLDAGWSRGLEETMAWIDTASDPGGTSMLIDAPLVVDNERGQQLCEKQVGQRYGRWDVSANTTNLNSPRKVGVTLREMLQATGWTYASGLSGPASTGRVMSECYPYTALVGIDALGYDQKRPRYKRKPRTEPVAVWREKRAAVCDDLIRQLALLRNTNPPMDLRSHPITAELANQHSPLEDKPYKHREDLIDAALAAYTALLWHTRGWEACQVLGPEQPPVSGELVATMIAPARPEQRRSPSR